MRRVAAGLLVAAAALAGTASTASARPCPRERGFDCATLNVPLDRSGGLKDVVGLHYAIQPAHGRKHVLLALTGGPGQNGIPFGPYFVYELQSALKTHRLLVLDQRGTGRSGVLNCPEAQGLNGLETYFAETASSCARRLGPRRDFFSSVDTADDIEAIRQKLGVEKIAIYGVSYGTWVAQQYARKHPGHVERLILDSVVPPDDDPYDLRSVQALPRVLRGLCNRGACAGITKDPAADLGAVVAKLRAGNLHGVIRDGDGGRRNVTFSQFDLLATLIGSDLNPWLRLRLPAALVAARAGDPVPLLRLRRDSAGSPPQLGDLSAGLFLATTCSDGALGYSLLDPFATRAAKAAAQLAALPDSAFAPWGREVVDRSSAPELCAQWPQGAPKPPVTGPLPDVPALILGGRDDLRTPNEGGRALARQLPKAQTVFVAGVGHDALGSDATGCAARALSRFFRDRPVGRPCTGKTNALPLAPVPPLRLADVPRAPGVPGDGRARVVFAAVATVADARTSTNESLYAGFQDYGLGGLRGGRFEIVATGIGDLLVFHDVQYVPGVHVDGSIFSSEGVFTGKLRVRGPDGMTGRLTLKDGRVSGTVAGRKVRVAASALKGARVARSGGGKSALLVHGPLTTG